MEYLCLFHQPGRQFLRRQHHVGAGGAVKGKVAVPVRQSVHKRQCGMNDGIGDKAAHVDPNGAQRVLQLAAKLVAAHLADKGCAFAEFCKHGQHVAGRSAGVRLKKGIALGAGPVFGEIDQKFTHGHNVKLLHGSFLRSHVARQRSQQKVRSRP